MASPLEAMADAGDGEDDGEGEGPNPESIDAEAMPPLALHNGRERWVGRHIHAKTCFSVKGHGAD